MKESQLLSIEFIEPDTIHNFNIVHYLNYKIPGILT